jgi:hypothetical protein
MNARLSTLLLLGACGAPDLSELYTQTAVEVVDDGAAANAVFTEFVSAAQDTLHVALPGLADTELAQALIDRRDAGVDVQVVVDFDQREDEGVALLRDADVPVRLADAGLAYFDFSINADVSFPSEDVLMTHSFAIADNNQALLSSQAGDLDSGARVLLHASGEDLWEDLRSEHVQVFGGSDATAQTAFSQMAKSIADARWAYPTASPEILEVWFGPQERITKRVVDAIYGARSSVRILSDDMAHAGLIAALASKASYGFDMEVVVGPNFGRSNSTVSNTLKSADDVQALQVSGAGAVPTIVLIDFEAGRDGQTPISKAFVLTHPFLPASRLGGTGDAKSDQLADGTMFVIGERGSPGANLQALEALYEQFAEQAEAL